MHRLTYFPNLNLNISILELLNIKWTIFYLLQDSLERNILFIFRFVIEMFSIFKCTPRLNIAKFFFEVK